MFRFLPIYATLALFVALLLPAACLKSPSAPTVQEPSTITLSTYRLAFTAINQQVRIDATVLDQDSRAIPDATVNWRSANRVIATVTDLGVVTATGGGTTQIIVTSGDATASATVTVEQAEDSIEITPLSITLTGVGQTGQFTAVVYDSGKRIIPDAVVGWTSSHPAIASVDAGGMVTAVSAGTAQVTASSGGESTSRPVYVETTQVPSRIVLNLSEATLSVVGQSLQLDAQVYDADGAAILDAQVAWTSSRTDVATVSANGLVIAVSNGTTRVTASSEDASAHATIHVVIGSTEPPPPPEPPPPSSDREVLIAFYYATGGPHWTNNTNWLSDEPIGEWYGVNANAVGRVTLLNLHENGLAAGLLPPVLGQLVNLQSLFLSDNKFTGNIPPEIGQLSNLTYMDLSGNQLMGEIPSEIGQLSNLRNLLLYDNRLTGVIPSEIGQLTKLAQLWLHDNRLSGGIPREIGNLADLRDLSLSRNAELAGPLPGSMTNLNLREIYLAETQLCAPSTDEFREWLDGIWGKQGVSFCEREP